MNVSSEPPELAIQEFLRIQVGSVWRNDWAGEIEAGDLFGESGGDLFVGIRENDDGEFVVRKPLNGGGKAGG